MIQEYKLSARLTAGTTNVVATAMVLHRLYVEAPGDAPINIYDAIAGAADADRIFLKANTAMAVGDVIDLNIPCSTGIRIVVATNQIVRVSYGLTPN